MRGETNLRNKSSPRKDFTKSNGGGNEIQVWLVPEMTCIEGKRSTPTNVCSSSTTQEKSDTNWSRVEADFRSDSAEINWAVDTHVLITTYL
jgi:hypothetical protein